MAVLAATRVRPVGFLKRNRQPAPDPMLLRVETSQGEQYDEPSEDALFMLMENLQHDQDYFILENASDTTGQTYIQVMWVGDGFLVERRSGSENTHEHAASTDLREVHQDLTTWAFGVRRENVLRWKPGYPAV